MRTTTIAAAAAVFAAAVAVSAASRSDRAPSAPRGEPVADHREEGRGPRIAPETREHLDAFVLTGGRKIRVSKADTLDGMGCLIEEDEAGAESSSCLEGGLFSKRKAEILVSSRGGPDRFDELHLVAVVAPEVRSASVVKTDGTTVAMRVDPSRTFVFESSVLDLQARVYPTALQLYGPSGKVVEIVDFPDTG